MFSVTLLLANYFLCTANRKKASQGNYFSESCCQVHSWWAYLLQYFLCMAPFQPFNHLWYSPFDYLWLFHAYLVTRTECTALAEALSMQCKLGEVITHMLLTQWPFQGNPPLEGFYARRPHCNELPCWFIYDLWSAITASYFLEDC